MISLKPIYQTKAHEKVVFDRIKDFLDELLFGYIDEVMSENPLENSKDDDFVDWITVHGNHIPIKKGQSVKEAIEGFLKEKEKSIDVSLTTLAPMGVTMKELREKAKEYYRKNFQGKPIYKEGLGSIRFSGKGIRETISGSSQDTLIRCVPYIGEIIEKGTIGKEEPSRKERTDGIVSFVPIFHNMTIKGKNERCGVLIGKDKDGHLYYDMFIKKPSGGSKTKSEVRREVDNSSVYNNSIAEDEYIVNLFFEKEKKTLENASSVIIDGLKSGKISYIDGYFIIKGRISNRLALEIELLGGKYNRHVGGYKVPEKTLPVDVAQTIARINIGNRDKITKIDDYLKNLDETKQYAFDNLSFNDEVNKIGTDLDGQFKKSVGKIDIIPADMNEHQKEEIANNYTKNMKYYIQKWTDQEIVKLRKDLEPFIMGGVRTGDLAKVIQQHKGVTDRKAKFLARQETKLLISEYQRNRYKQAGVTHYRWSTNIDGRERPWHRKLNGQIFSWDNPPIIDERTGERGHPGQTYNCRCVAVPLADFG